MSKLPSTVLVLAVAWLGILGFVLVGIGVTLFVRCLFDNLVTAIVGCAFAAAFIPLVWLFSRILFPVNYFQRKILTSGLGLAGLTILAGYSGTSAYLKFALNRLTTSSKAGLSSMSVEGDGSGGVKWGEPDYHVMWIGVAILAITVLGARFYHPSARTDDSKTA